MLLQQQLKTLFEQKQAKNRRNSEEKGTTFNKIGKPVQKRAPFRQQAHAQAVAQSRYERHLDACFQTVASISPETTAHMLAAITNFDNYQKYMRHSLANFLAAPTHDPALARAFLQSYTAVRAVRAGLQYPEEHMLRLTIGEILVQFDPAYSEVDQMGYLRLINMAHIINTDECLYPQTYLDLRANTDYLDTRYFNTTGRIPQIVPVRVLRPSEDERLQQLRDIMLGNHNPFVTRKNRFLDLLGGGDKENDLCA